MSCTSSHTKSAVQLGDIFRKYQHLLPYTGDWEWKVINAITSCRTWKLGSHDYKCDTCGQVLTVYNSCRNRHFTSFFLILDFKEVEEYTMPWACQGRMDS
jgi:hypothetical protein